MHVVTYEGCFMMTYFLQMFGKNMKEYQSAKDIMTTEAIKVCGI